MKLMDIKNGIGPEWAEKGYQMPQFDIEAVRKKTHEEPVWVHSRSPPGRPPPWGK